MFSGKINKTILHFHLFLRIVTAALYQKDNKWQPGKIILFRWYAGLNIRVLHPNYTSPACHYQSLYLRPFTCSNNVAGANNVSAYFRCFLLIS
jgi:hypothetical protein